MAGVSSAISVTPAVLFLWSLIELGLFLLSLSLPLSLPLSLFTFNPVLEVPCVLLVTFFSEDLNMASVSVNRKKKKHRLSENIRNKTVGKLAKNVVLWNVMPTNERRSSISWCWCCILIHTLAGEQCDWWRSEELIYGGLWVGNFPPILMQLNWETPGAAKISASVIIKLHFSSKNPLHFPIFG